MTDIDCIQINLHHSIAPTGNLTATLADTNKANSFIAFIQEPYCTEGKVRGLTNKGYLIQTIDKDNQPRAALLISKDLPTFQLTNFCDRDIAAAIITIETRNIVVASVYMPHDSNEHPSVSMQNLVQYCEQRKLELIIGADVNSHHWLWGCNNTNNRGDELVDYISTTDLHILNRGHTPTFVTQSRSEILDVTLSTSGIMPKIKDWKVDMRPSMSDHRTILFKITREKPEPIEFRNKKKLNASEYIKGVHSDLEAEEMKEIQTEIELNSKVDRITNILITHYHKCTPLVKIKPDRKRPMWWNKDITILRKACRMAFRKAVRTSDENDWSSYKSALRAFKKAIRQAKRNHWMTFCNEVEKLPEASRLYRILKDDKVINLGPLEKEDGTWTNGPEESLKLLLEEHFPRNESSIETPVLPTICANAAKQMSEKIITKHKVRAAVKSFNAYRAAGSDEIHPALLQLPLDDLLDHLVEIFRACIRLGSVPLKWQQSRVVFIPKPGKKTYCKPSSWRPISLTSFMLKTLERLIDWHIKTPELVARLRSVNQFAYLRGASTDSALHRYVSNIEKSLKSQEVAIGVLLDIEGAFNKVLKAIIIRNLLRLNISVIIVRWIAAMLSNREVTSICGTIICSILATCGCPQGGVLSPFLWNCVMDELLTELHEKAKQCSPQAFADDLALLQRGKCFEVCHQMIQPALKIIFNWCRQVCLPVNPAKAEAIIFTLKTKVTTKPLKLGTAVIPYKETVKYLGVFLDHKLSWLPHCMEKSKKMKVALLQCKRAISSRLGIRPAIMKWIYTAVIRPALFYGVVVWGTAFEKANCLKRVEAVQRLALLLITGALKTTPTAALECLVGIEPVKITGNCMGVRVMHRLLQTGSWKNFVFPASIKRRTHIEYYSRIYNEIPILEFPCDVKKTNPLVESKAKFFMPSLKTWMKRGEPKHAVNDYVCYTDGSRHNGRTGAAYHVLHGSSCFEEIMALGEYTTVFQAEILAILLVVRKLQSINAVNENIYIYSDSKSSIEAINTWWSRTRLVDECFWALKELADNNNVKLYWIPAHKGFQGNEKADDLAKAARSSPIYGPELIILVGLCQIKTAVYKW